MLGDLNEWIENSEDVSRFRGLGKGVLHGYIRYSECMMWVVNLKRYEEYVIMYVKRLFCIRAKQSE